MPEWPRLAPIRFLAKAIVVLTLALFARRASCLDRAAALRDFHWRAWTTDNGLPQDSIYAVTQTRDGYLWIATHEGLARFDGRAFQVFSQANTPSLRHNIVRALFEDGAGVLWIGTRGDWLTRRQGGLLTDVEPRDAVPHGTALVVFEDSRRRLWTGGLDGVRLRTETGFVRYAVADGLAPGNVNAIVEDAEGRIWVGTDGGVSRWEEGRFRTFTEDDGLSSRIVRALYVDGARRLWAGTDAGLDRWDGARFVHHGGRASVYAIRGDRDGNVWVGTTDGLARVLPDGVSDAALMGGAQRDTVTAIYEDREGTLWVGTQGSGLLQVTDVPFRSYTTADGLPSDDVKSVDEGPDGSLWVATAEGVARLKDGRWTRAAGLARDNVWSIRADRRGRVWMRSGASVDVLENGRVRRTPLRVSSPIRSGTFYEDRAGHVWIAAPGGVYREDDDGRIVPVPLTGHPDDARPLSLLETRDGAMWIGEMRGLVELRDGAPTLHTTPDGRLERVVTLHEDAAGTLWAGTWGGGLCRRANGAFRCFSMTEGLPSNNVYQILEDDRQTLWLSSSRGVARVRKEDIQAFEEGRRKTIAATLYGIADGLPTSMCRGDSQPAGLATRGGLLFFPTAKGLAWIDPRPVDRTRAVAPPPVVVQRLVVDGQDVALSDDVHLPPGRQRLEVQFAGLSFLAPGSVRYRYRLDGFDRDWVDAGHETAASYTGLRPGRYVLRVSAANNDGLWSTAEAALPIVLAPHFYETWWFVVAMVVGLVALAGSGHALRMRLARRRFEAILSERLRVARELHDSLEQELAALSMPMQMLRKRSSTPEDREPIDAMSTILARCALSVKAAIWDLRSGHDLAGELRTIAERLAAGRAITVAVDVFGTPASLPERVQRQLLRIGQEALTNAVRHASPRNIRIVLQVAPGHVQLCLRDDGCGFEVAEEEWKLGHFGLVGMRERVHELKGKLRVTSQIGAGTEVAVDVALGQ